MKKREYKVKSNNVSKLIRYVYNKENNKENLKNKDGKLN